MKKTSKYPVKLRVTFQRVTKYYQTIFDLSKAEWEKLTASRVGSDLQTIRDKIKEIERNSEGVIKGLEPLSFLEFEKTFIESNLLFKQKKLKDIQIVDNAEEFDYTSFYKRFSILKEVSASGICISYSYRNIIKRLLREGSIGTAVGYHCSYVSLKKFRHDVVFTSITPSYLMEYENWLKAGKYPNPQ